MAVFVHFSMCLSTFLCDIFYHPLYRKKSILVTLEHLHLHKVARELREKISVSISQVSFSFCHPHPATLHLRWGLRKKSNLSDFAQTYLIFCVWSCVWKKAPSLGHLSSTVWPCGFSQDFATPVHQRCKNQYGQLRTICAKALIMGGPMINALRKRLLNLVNMVN